MTRTTKQDTRRLLADVPEQYAFRCHNGNILRNARDLRDALLDMSDNTFTFHSNSEKRDFIIWVRDVIGDLRLARDLARSTSRLQAAKRTADRVALLSDKLAR